MITGRKNKFSVSPPIAAEAKSHIKIKENKKGYEFGVITVDQNTSAAVNNLESVELRIFLVHMFNSEIADVESFEIWEEEKECKVAAIKYDRSRKVLLPTREKRFIEKKPLPKREIVKSGSKILMVLEVWLEWQEL